LLQQILATMQENPFYPIFAIHLVRVIESGFRVQKFQFAIANCLQVFLPTGLGLGCGLFFRCDVIRPIKGDLVAAEVKSPAPTSQNLHNGRLLAANRRPRRLYRSC
jgi:hypothetical protein